MSLILTNVYLEPEQRNALEQLAAKNHSNLSVEVRKAIDVYKAGLSLDELHLLDVATQRAQVDIAAMNEILEAGLARAEKFFAEIERIKAETPR